MFPLSRALAYPSANARLMYQGLPLVTVAVESTFAVEAVDPGITVTADVLHTLYAAE